MEVKRYRTNGTNKSEKEDEETVMSISQQNTMDLLSQKLWYFLSSDHY
jgi:hypothetical protein